ncbi:hypothetical protein DTO027B9_6013 [Paecilomyces variotii]|nr:hypothetical protein DTO027B9_6013 [Paecilomyces variotii]
MTTLVAVGACYVDLILSVDHYPNEDEKLRASRLTRRRGGNCPNTIEVLEQLIHIKEKQQEEKKKNDFESLSPVLVTVLPARSSPAVQFVRDSFGAGVDLTHCLYRQDFHEPASSYIISSRRTSSRTIVNYNELPEMTHDEFNALIDRLDVKHSGGGMWFHFEGRIPDVNLQNIKSLRNRLPAATISVEVEKPGRPGLQELAAEADVVFYAKGWAQNAGYTEPKAFLHAQAPLTPKAKIIFCTWGEHGASALELPSQAYVSCPTYKKEGASVVDTIGAGDTFIAGILYALNFHGNSRSESWTLERSLGFATELAGRKVIQEGFGGLGEQMAGKL